MGEGTVRSNTSGRVTAGIDFRGGCGWSGRIWEVGSPLEIFSGGGRLVVCSEEDREAKAPRSVRLSMR